MFDRARDADYEELARQARDLAGALGEEPAAERRAEARAQLARLQARLAQVAAIDFFGAHGREAAEGLLAAPGGPAARGRAGRAAPTGAGRRASARCGAGPG